MGKTQLPTYSSSQFAQRDWLRINRSASHNVPRASEQRHRPLTATKATLINVELVQEFKVEITKRRRFLQDGVRAMSVAAAYDDSGQIIAGVIGRITEVAADDDCRVIQ